MKIIFSLVIFFTGSFCFSFEIGERIITTGPNSGRKLRDVVEEYTVPGSAGQHIPQDAIDDTFDFFDRYYAVRRRFQQTTVARLISTEYEYLSISSPTTMEGPAIWNADHVIIFDMTKPLVKKRLHLINIVTGEIESIQSSHGLGSDCPGRIACRFSNSPDGNASPLGFFVTGQMFNSREHGLSIIMSGLEGNSAGFTANDRPTTIVIHSAWYMNNGSVGRSNGCVALSDNNMNRLREKMDNGVLFYFYHSSLGSNRVPAVSGLQAPANSD